MVMTVDLLFTYVDFLINKGISLGAVASLILFKLPSIMVLTFPVATLFGIAMAMGRLGKDNEISALRTSGTSFGRIALPIIIFSVIISAGSFLINEEFVPFATLQSDKIIREIILRQPIPEIKQDVFFKDAHNRYYYIKRMDNRTKELEGILVYELNTGQFPRVISASKAKLEGLDLVLNSGFINKLDNSGRIEYEASFDEMALNLKEDILNISAQKSSEGMNTKELSEEINSLKKSGASTNSLRTDFYMKFSVPLTCFVFALIGLPLSLPGIRTNRTWGLVLTIVIMFTFYVFASVFRSLGRGGIVDPVFAAWTPHVLFGILGLILLVKEVKFK